MTHWGIGVIIYQGGLSARHPKGARSIGIGHPRSGDRCTKTLPYPHDPLWVAEQIPPPSATRKGSWHNAYDYTSVVGTSCLDRCLWSGHPCGCRYAVRASILGLDVRLVRQDCTPGRAPRKGCLPAAWRTVLSDGAMPYRTSRTGRTSAVPNRTGRRSLRGSYGSRQGSPLHSHRSSRNSGDDLWADRPLDLDPARASHIRGELDSATP